MDKLVKRVHFSDTTGRSPLSAIVSVTAVSAGIWLFAFSIHNNPAIALIALFLTSLGIAFHVSDFTELLKLTGLLRYNQKVALYCIIVITVAIALGIYLNVIYAQPILPVTLTFTAVIAGAVGIAEEIVFRGYMQGVLSNASARLGIFASSAIHTIYKVLVLSSFSASLGINLAYIALFTFAVGILAAWARQASGSILPTALGHMYFDIVVYGSLSAVPVWVWG